MEKLLRILFVMSAIAFVTTVTACADDDKTGGNDKTAINPGFFKFTPEAKGVTIDTTKDVYKITINPSLLNYADVDGVGIAALAPAPIFTVTFTDDNLQGFIIPTTVDKAEALSTMHVDNLAMMKALIVVAGEPNNLTHSFLADDNPGFGAAEINAEWSKHITVKKAPEIAEDAFANQLFVPEVAADVPGVPNILESSKVRVLCITTIKGINKDSFKKKAPAAKDDLAIDKGTETVCKFSLVGIGTDDEKKAAYKTWATKAVAAAKDDATKNIQKMGFVGIVTGDATASAITKAAGGSRLNTDNTAATSAKLVKAYNSVLQKVEIVIAAAK